MEVQYRQLFLKDLKKLKGQQIYNRVYELAFTILPQIDSLENIANVKAMKGFSNRYRVRIGDYRVGFVVDGDKLEIMRVLHRREFYRYFP